jgi:hypothetical protein
MNHRGRRRRAENRRILAFLRAIRQTESLKATDRTDDYQDDEENAPLQMIGISPFTRRQASS